MVPRLDRVVSPTGAVVRVAVPQRSLYLTARIVVVHVIRSVQADLDNGSTPGFLQPDARCLGGCIRLLVQQPGSIIEGLNHHEGQPELRSMRKRAAGRCHLNGETAETCRSRNK